MQVLRGEGGQPAVRPALRAVAPARVGVKQTCERCLTKFGMEINIWTPKQLHNLAVMLSKILKSTLLVQIFSVPNAGGDYNLFVHYLYSIAYMSDELYQHADLQLPPDQVLPHRRLRGLDEHQLPEDLHLW